MPDLLVRGGGRLVPWLVAAVSVGIGLAVVRPFADAPVGFDTQATVAYFDRLAAGIRLEQALSTTPKPFLTVVYGVLHAPTGDWRPIIWATILVHGVAAALASLVTTRAAGLAAGVAAGIAVAGTTLLIEDAAFGNAVPWALAGWLAAAAWLIGPRTRPILAGTVLCLAALCRLETLVIVAVAGAALGWARVGPWPLPGPRPAPPARLWWAVAIPFLALPAMLVHDWLLTGDPFFWVAVSARYAEARAATLDILGPIERISWFVRRYLAVWPAVAFALVGFASLVRDRRWGELVGLAGMGPGIAAFLVLLAARGLYAPHRYAIPVDVTLVLLAAIGVARVAIVAAGRVARAAAAGPGVPRAGGMAGARTGVVAATFALAIGWVAAAGGGPFDPELARAVDDTRTLNENAARVMPILRETAGSRPNGTPIGWFVPSAVRPRIAVDLGVPLTDVGGLSLRALDPASATFAPGQRVFHDLRGDLPRGGYAVLEAGDEIRLGGVVLRPLLIDADRSLWLYAVMPAS